MNTWHREMPKSAQEMVDNGGQGASLVVGYDRMRITAVQLKDLLLEELRSLSNLSKISAK